MRTVPLCSRIAGAVFALAAVLPLATVSAQTAGYPAKPVRIIVPAAAGSAADVVARMLGERVARTWSQPWVIDNRPGAGGTIGADAVAKSAPDGYTLLFTANNFIIAPSMYPSVPYDVYRDFTPIGLVATGQDAIFVNPALNVKTLPELVAAAKRTSGGLNYGAPFYGTSAHLIMEMLKRTAGVELTFIPASGGPQSFSEAVAGRVPIVIGSIAAGAGMVKSGRLNAIAVVDRRRSDLLPEVPTLTEAGYPQINLPFWFGLYGPARVQPVIVQQVNRDTGQVLNSPEFAEALLARGFVPRSSTPAELEALMRESQPVFAKAIADSGIKPQQ